MSAPERPAGGKRIGFLGPEGTFTEQALLSQPDLAAHELVALPSIPDVLLAVESGQVDLGFVGIENSIEGAVTVTVDTLGFETDLLIQGEVVMGVQMNLLAPSGVGVSDVRRVLSIPVATAQCRGSSSGSCPGCDVAGHLVDGRGGHAGGRARERRPHRGGRPRGGGQGVRARRAGHRHRGPSRQRHPLRGGGPLRHPRAHGPRQDVGA